MRGLRVFNETTQRVRLNSLRFDTRGLAQTHRLQTMR